MDQTFQQLWRKLLVYCPSLPIPLAQEFVNTAYSRVIAGNRWSRLRGTSGFLIPDEYSTGTITLTNGSTTVTGSGTTFTSAMVGRQLMPSQKAPYLDIAAYVGPTELTLATAWGGPTTSDVAYSIVGAYHAVPTDFLMFLSIVDVENNWKLHTNFLPEQIDLWDAQRTSTGNPWIIMPAPPTSAGARRMEIWPRPSTEKYLPFTYIKKPALLSSPGDLPIWPIRGDVLIEGALSEVARWPGLANQPNPYFSLQLHKEHEERFWREVWKCEVEDQEFAQTRVEYPDFYGVMYAPIDASFIQAHGGVPF